MANRTHCRRGHELVGDNLHIGTDGRRRCRLCCCLRKRGYRAAQKPTSEGNPNRAPARAVPQDEPMARDCVESAFEPEPEPCDCGEEKEPGDECCARCAYLDGIAKRGRGRVADVIAALRSRGHQSIEELTESSGRDYRAVHRTLAELRKRGRVARLPSDEWNRGGWLYVLVDRQEVAA